MKNEAMTREEQAVDLGVRIKQICDGHENATVTIACAALLIAILEQYKPSSPHDFFIIIRHTVIGELRRLIAYLNTV